MKFKDGKTFSAYVRSKLHSGYITNAWKEVAKIIDAYLLIIFSVLLVSLLLVFCIKFVP